MPDASRVFWTDFWAVLSSIDGTISSPDAMVERYRKSAQEKVQTSFDSDSSVFNLAWNAHTFCTSEEDTSAVMAGSEGDSFTWRQKLGCLMLLEALCGVFGSEKTQSPFFPLLVQDTLLSLHTLHQSKAPDRQLQEACFLQVAERFLPDLLGNDVYEQFQSALDSNAQPEPAVLQALDDAVAEWTGMYQDENYVAPTVWARSESERTDLKKLLSQVSKEEEEKFQLAELLRPLPSMPAPFVRPLPPPLLPLCGYEEHEEPLNEEEEAEALEYLHAELLWLTPTNLRLLLLPDDEKDDEEASERFRQVLDLLQNQAFVKPLAPNEQRIVLQTFGNNLGGQKPQQPQPTQPEETLQMGRQLVRECGLNAQNLPKLVENNPLVAYECLVQILLSEDDATQNEYLSSLVGMDLSLQVMEVVNRLAMHHTTATSADGSTGQPILHAEYIHLFISACIASCENYKDQHVQNRLVRLVCVFIQSLLRYKIVAVDDIYFEVQAFCVEFSRIREASALYKSLKE